jgi:hypothetical protein
MLGLDAVILVHLLLVYIVELANGNGRRPLELGLIHS